MYSDPKHARVVSTVCGTERMYAFIRRGELHFVCGVEGQARPVRRFRLYDDATKKPVAADLEFEGRAWFVHTGDRELVYLDDPARARPRCAIIGEETEASTDHAAGYVRGYFGKRAASFRETERRSAEWLDGYQDGLRHQREDRR